MSASDKPHDPAAVALLEGCGAGLGGRIKVEPEDFLVEEIPLYRPSGRGDQTFALIEKRATPTFDALLFISKTAKVSERSIGYSGLKDARAVARQYVTVPKVSPERLLAIRHRKFRVLSAVAHERALKIGHLLGNRFTIRIRDADLERVEEAWRVLEVLVKRGMPNAYGGQRFGVRNDGHLLGRAMVREDWQEFVDQLLGRPMDHERNPEIVAARHAYDRGDLAGAHELFPMKHRTEKKAAGVLARGGSPLDAFEALGAGPRRIWISAWQSYLFNRVLDRRVRDGTYGQLLAGDIAWHHDSSATVRITDPAADADRAAALQLSPTGPLVGYDGDLPDGAAGQLERAVFAEDGIDPEAFREGPGRARGLRRPLRVPLDEASLDVETDGAVVVRFVLPPGGFATVALEHLMAGPTGVGNRL
ncbi:MAG: tRNA pseudouridine(13) synthase TruD [Planctomycetota bacterium]|nr:tRNA pseudouridine(13) synthase TruD [Planctomycetota bacterium]